jgi:hypothetical protein
MDSIRSSRSKWLDTTKQGDNFGFAKWVEEHAEELVALGPGRHFGEWWGGNIQRGYGITEKRFSLFNVHRWHADNPPPACCSVVPLLYRGAFSTTVVEGAIADLRLNGSEAAPGFMKPEGVIVYQEAAKQYFKVLLENDDAPKTAISTD